MSSTTYAPGTRLLVRDAEWIVKRVDRTSSGFQAITAIGLSEIVRDKEAVFLDEIEKDGIQVVRPENTKLVADESPYYRNSILYIESLLRQTPPTDDKLYIGYRGAMDTVPYQLDPAIQALKQPRQRILMADAVGLGKTVEVGILLSELIRRGRGKRILVLAVKSMLTQFQKELWSRFTIPLVRLDSIGIQRIRSHIPTNHNPFYYYDRAIISIDTLKQDAEYRTYLENCYWDIIVIDEAHNVAERGSHSLRAKLAKLLSGRSDTLIMASATPHDGRARSFASLMNMLDPTAITNSENYGPEDIKGLFIRRFKKDIQGQVTGAFKERRIHKVRCKATPVEEQAYHAFTRIQFTQINQRRSGGILFKTTLEKALFSSPMACLETIENRIKSLTKKEEPRFQADIDALKQLQSVVEAITPEFFSKYRKLLDVLQNQNYEMSWNGDDPADRLVVFTERIETLKFLYHQLQKDLNLKKEQVEMLHGGLSDIEQQRIVEEFGRDESPVRLLVASDVASEGINLHYLSHKMIHFDIPWSFMVFQQRNGRIDRYGQTRNPLIMYLMTESENEKIKGDVRILELLIEKDDNAVKNIGDPSAIMAVYDIEMEEERTARAIEQNLSREEFDRQLSDEKFDPFEILLQNSQNMEKTDYSACRKSMPSLFASDYDYFRQAADYISASQPLQIKYDEERQIVNMTVPDELKQHRFKYLPQDILPQDGVLALCRDRTAIMREIQRTREQENTWPQLHLLWEQHPVLEWMNDKILSAFGRNEAPVICLPVDLGGNSLYLVSGLMPNRKGQPVLHEWFALRFKGPAFIEYLNMHEFLRLTKINQRIPNTGASFDAEILTKALPEVVQQARQWISVEWLNYEFIIEQKLETRIKDLERLRADRHRFMREKYDMDNLSDIQKNKFDNEKRHIDRLFDAHKNWVRETLTIKNDPYIRIVAVFTGTN
ncbi:DEAD/DEAH box helicase [candidate division KSB1 bacterium]|nr:DEAD/DEAH box helicase [candidate division KSB1 bacterium]